MSIRPVDFNGMLQRTDDVGVLKQHEDNKPVVDQQNIQAQVAKNEDAMLHQVKDPGAGERMENHADAKEEGHGAYYMPGKRKKKEKKQEPGKVINKNQSGSFDIKI